INDNYFELGGNSAKIIQLKRKLKKKFTKDIPVTALFRHTTISSQVRYLEEEARTSQSPTGTMNDNKEEQNTLLLAAVSDTIRQTPEHTGLEIAVTGMAGRFPGVKGIGAFHHNLEQGKNSITFYDRAELEEAGIPKEQLDNPQYVQCGGGRLENADSFDSTFFGYTPAEAGAMDPQVRLFHECVYEALEDGG
ncbi:MAG: hypothetical protein GY765_28705, partial [bacterium]|nr:hypothetical protein [bacterium]